MKYYFDNRNFTDVYVRIFSDESELGYVHLQKNKINVINLFENSSKIRFSFSKDKPNIKKIHSSFITEEPFNFKKEKLNQEYRRIHDKWQFPYDCVIDIVHGEDVYFFPQNFKQKELQGGLYYAAKKVNGHQNLEMQLIKKTSIEQIEQIRKKRITKYFAINLLLMLILFFAAKEFFGGNDTPLISRSMACLAIAAIGGAFLASYEIKENLHYVGMFQPKKLKECYQILENGDIL